MIKIKHVGDITKIKGADVPLVDIVTGGSPCQDLSCAGKRAGLAGERSGLFMDQIRIIKEMREHDRRNNERADELVRPRYMVWENVAGAFSSNKGEDFRAVLEETAKVADKDAYVPGLEGGKWSPCGCILGNGWSIAWRVHDAQYWGVPQRRKRICLLADFNGDTAGKILFELRREAVDGDTEQTVADTGASSRSEVQPITESLSGNTQTRGKEGKGIAEDIERCAGEAGKCLNGWDIQSKHIQPEDGRAESLYSGECRYGGGESYVLQNGAISFQERAGKPGGGKGILIQNERTGALSTLNNQSVCCLNAQGGSQMSASDDVSGTLRAEEHGHQPLVFEPGAASRLGGYCYNDMCGTLRADMGDNHAIAIENHPADSRVKISEDGMVQTLSSRMGTGGGNVPMVMEPILLESNQNHATIQTDGVSTALPASMGMGGGYVPMIVEPTVFSETAAARCAQDGRGGVHSQMPADPEGNFVVEPISASKASFFTNANDTGTAETLVATDYKDPQIVAYDLDRASYNQGMNAKYDFSVDEEKVGTCVAKGPNAVCKAVDCLNGRGKDVNGTLAANARKSLNSGNVVRCESVVRRLTPMECERLQGFPDNWTNIGDWVDSKGKTHKGESDSPRYKALGNSIALPFWAWMAERMMPYLPENPTMASLFDGIGGFPLVFSRCGCEPVWASEIEEFPIAVTKKRFPEQKEG